MNTVSFSNSCPRCGAAIPAEAPDGLCPRCVLLGAATPSESGSLSRLGEPSPLDAVRAAFPHLEIDGLIGRGGMGFVYRARQPQLDRSVALKLLPVPAGADPTFAERFAREGRLLARLNHPNIVAVYDFGQAAGFAFLLLEFVDGVNLRQAMQAGRFSAREALAIVPKICDALQFAHQHGVLHRDIKPENILLDTAGGVKIADFGIAKLVGDRPGDITLTASGSRLGTPHYMAPEQVETPSEVDHRADIYSLGVVFYELLTGELPLGRFSAPSAKVELDARVDAIVMRALAKERELRQQSAGEVKTEVEGLGTPVAETLPPAPPAGIWSVNRDFEYKSPRTFLGLPLVHVVSGWDPKTGRPREARGILAVGPRAEGWLAVGGQARGILAFGGVAVGVFAFGGIAVGGLAFGGLAAGLASFGGLAIGLLLACGGIAVGLEAFGGLAVGKWAAGGVTVSQYTATPGYWRDWLLNAIQWLWLLAVIPAMVPIAVSLWVRQLQRRFGSLPAGSTPTSGPTANPWPHRLFCLLVGLVALPAAAIVAFLLGPILQRVSGGLGGLTAGLVPMATGALLIWLIRRTRPTAAQAKPREQWNPWPKRIFVLVMALVVLPASLVFVGLLIPYLLSRAAVRPPLPTPLATIPGILPGGAMGGSQPPTAGAEWPVQLVRSERVTTPDQVRLRWELRSPAPASVRLSLDRRTAEVQLSRVSNGDFKANVIVRFERQEDRSDAVEFKAIAEPAMSVERFAEFSVMLSGEPRELLAKADELVAGDLPLKFNTPIWIAFVGLEQVRLEVIPEAPTLTGGANGAIREAGGLPQELPADPPDAAALKWHHAWQQVAENRKKAEAGLITPNGPEALAAERDLAVAEAEFRREPRIAAVAQVNYAEQRLEQVRIQSAVGRATQVEVNDAMLKLAQAKEMLNRLDPPAASSAPPR